MKSPVFKILSIVVLLAVVLYFGVQIYRFYDNPFSTALAYEFSYDDGIPLSGWFVRQEEPFTADAMAVTHPVAEGERVGRGQAIAVAYRDSSALDTVRAIEDLELRLQQQEFALTAYLDQDAALKLDSAITGDIMALRRSISGGDYSASSAEVSALKAAVLKRSSPDDYDSVEEIQANIASAQAELTALRQSLSGDTTVTAPTPGTYSAVCDGYETVLTKDFLTQVTPSALSSLQPDKQAHTIGKLIYGDTWYYVAALSVQDAQRLHKGDTVTMRLAKGLEQDVPVRVVRLSPEEDGQRAVVLSCNRFLAQTTLLRRQAATLILCPYTGLRIPYSALRIDEADQPGVYCAMGKSARFKPVTVLYQGEDFALVEPSPEAQGAAVLRGGDEVIVTAGDLDDLSDGAVVR